MIEAAAIYWLLGALWISICIACRFTFVKPDTILMKILFIIIGGAIWPLIFAKYCWDLFQGRNRTDL